METHFYKIILSKLDKNAEKPKIIFLNDAFKTHDHVGFLECEEYFKKYYAFAVLFKNSDVKKRDVLYLFDKKDHTCTCMNL